MMYAMGYWKKQNKKQINTAERDSSRNLSLVNHPLSSSQQPNFATFDLGGKSAFEDGSPPVEGSAQHRHRSNAQAARFPQPQSVI